MHIGEFMTRLTEEMSGEHRIFPPLSNGELEEWRAMWPNSWNSSGRPGLKHWMIDLKGRLVESTKPPNQGVNRSAASKFRKIP